jgi:hypothetical protein
MATFPYCLRYIVLAGPIIGGGGGGGDQGKMGGKKITNILKLTK